MKSPRAKGRKAISSPSFVRAIYDNRELKWLQAQILLKDTIQPTQSFPA